MKRTISSGVLALVALALTAATAETPPTKDEQQLLALVEQIKAQQNQLTDNQTKIDSKMEDLTEVIRVARLSAGKAGK
jgi:hypothetical protein